MENPLISGNYNNYNNYNNYKIPILSLVIINVIVSIINIILMEKNNDYDYGIDILYYKLFLICAILYIPIMFQFYGNIGDTNITCFAYIFISIIINTYILILDSKTLSVKLSVISYILSVLLFLYIIFPKKCNSEEDIEPFTYEEYKTYKNNEQLYRATDGKCYDKDSLKIWLESNEENTLPLTRKNASKDRRILGII